MKPLEDVRVIAVEQYGAGPFGSVHLADRQWAAALGIVELMQKIHKRKLNRLCCGCKSFDTAKLRKR